VILIRSRSTPTQRAEGPRHPSLGQTGVPSGRSLPAGVERPRSQPPNPQRAESPHHPSLVQTPQATTAQPSGLKARAILAWGNAPGHNRLTLGGLKARAKCLIRHSQPHESKSPSIEDIFLLPFSAQKSHVKPSKPSQSHKTQQPRTFLLTLPFGKFPHPNAYH
jgi:hypothetical protein